jgi:hypothetical protein
MSSVRRRTEAPGSTLTSMGGCVSQRTDQPQGPAAEWISNLRRGFDELTSRTRQRGRQTRACDQFAARPYRRTVGGGPASVFTRIFAARTGRESSLVPVGSYGVQRPRKVASEKRRVPGRIAMHNHTASIKWRRLAEELERLWNEHLRNLHRSLARTASARVQEATRFRGRFPRTQLRNATRMLKEQLRAEGVSVWVSAGCLAELARIASAAAARTRQADEPYESCLRREIVTHARFIREWTSSDKKFDQTQWSELTSIARKYALPRSWRLYESVASVRWPSATAQIPAPRVFTSLAGQQPQVRYSLGGAAVTSLAANGTGANRAAP